MNASAAKAIAAPNSPGVIDFAVVVDCVITASMGDAPALARHRIAQSGAIDAVRC
jgi:hypothetical protein